MGEKSSVDSAVTLGVATVGGIQIFWLFRRLRHRATHPNMDDPGRDLERWQKVAAAAVGAVAVIVIVGLFAWLGPIAIILAVAVVLLAILALIVIAAWLWLAAEGRRRVARYVICEDDYVDAPRQIKSTMRRIYKSAKEVDASQANEHSMFGELSLNEVVYGAAERAILSSELAAAARDLRPNAASSDQPLLDEVNDQIRAITDELASVEATFKHGAKTAEKLSQRISEPERQRVNDQERRAAASTASERRKRARTQLEEVNARAKAASTSDLDDLVNRIESVAGGYDEATKVSDGILKGPRESPSSEPDDNAPPSSSARDSATRAAKIGANAAKWSPATAKSQAEKYKK